MHFYPFEGSVCLCLCQSVCLCLSVKSIQRGPSMQGRYHRTEVNTGGGGGVVEINFGNLGGGRRVQLLIFATTKKKLIPPSGIKKKTAPYCEKHEEENEKLKIKFLSGWEIICIFVMFFFFFTFFKESPLPVKKKWGIPPEYNFLYIAVFD